MKRINENRNSRCRNECGYGKNHPFVRGQQTPLRARIPALWWSSTKVPGRKSVPRPKAQLRWRFHRCPPHRPRRKIPGAPLHPGGDRLIMRIGHVIGRVTELRQTVCISIECLSQHALNWMPEHIILRSACIAELKCSLLCYIVCGQQRLERHLPQKLRRLSERFRRYGDSPAKSVGRTACHDAPTERLCRLSQLLAGQATRASNAGSNQESRDASVRGILQSRHIGNVKPE